MIVSFVFVRVLNISVILRPPRLPDRAIARFWVSTRWVQGRVPSNGVDRSTQDAKKWGPLDRPLGRPRDENSVFNHRCSISIWDVQRVFVMAKEQVRPPECACLGHRAYLQLRHPHFPKLSPEDAPSKMPPAKQPSKLSLSTASGMLQPGMNLGPLALGLTYDP